LRRGRRGERRGRWWWFEAAIVVAVYEAYRLLRIAVRGAPARALRNSRSLVRIERRVDLFHERQVQHWLLPHHWLIRAFDAYHAEAHFIAVGLTLVLLWRSDRVRYRAWRNTFGGILALGLVGFALLPLTPPRLMPHSFGFVDTAARIGGIGRVGAEAPPGGGGNEFACLPSLHAAWSVWVAIALWPRARTCGRWARGLLLLHVAVMHVAIVAAAKHWIIDAPAGWTTLALARALERSRTRWWRHRRRR